MAYFNIPIVLIMISNRRPDFVPQPVLRLFAAFILLCGIATTPQARPLPAPTRPLDVDPWQMPPEFDQRQFKQAT